MIHISVLLNAEMMKSGIMMEKIKLHVLLIANYIIYKVMN